jgi:hypothetical protein
MEHQSKLFSGAVQSAAAFDCVSHLKVDWRLAQAAHLELQQMGLPRVNLLLLGPDTVTQNVLELLLPDLHDPITTWCPGERLMLRPPTQAGTMIFYDVGALARDDQRRLLEHLGRATIRPQVVSTSSTPLLPRVHAGTFNETLYYRLNTICLDLNI